MIALDQELGPLQRGLRRGKLSRSHPVPLGDALARPLHRHRQPLFFDRLQQVIERLQPERLHRILIVGGRHHEIGQRHALLAQLADHAHAIEPRHLHVEEHEVGLEVGNQLYRLQAIGRRGDHLDVGKFLQQIRQFVGSQLFVVRQDCGDRVRRASRHKSAHRRTRRAIHHRALV